MSEQNVVEASQEAGGEGFEGDFGNGFEGGADDDGQGGQPAPGMGQSKSSRRRRRKRKKLTSGPAPATAAGSEPNGDAEASPASHGAVPIPYAPVVMQGESLALVASGVPAPPNGAHRRSGTNGGQPGVSNGQGQGQGSTQGKRWKKKFRDRERRPGAPAGEPRPEGSGSSSGGERSFSGDRGYERPHRREGGRPDNFGNLVTTQHRKTKSGGGKDRGFVGPMDHSYREASPEFGDVPPSTIQMRGRRGHRQQGDSQPIDHNAPRPVPISEDAQTHIYLFIEDLFITAKVQETARKLGVKVAFVKNEKEAISELTSGGETNRPSLIVFDLNNANAKPLTLIPKLKTKLKRSASIVGFLSSIQGDLKAKAVEVGCDTVMPKAAFSQNLPNLLRRYGVEEADEVNYNY